MREELKERASRSTKIPGTPLADAATGLDLCVHCGFCLQACPTYLTLDDENDSPRGRLVLMRAAVEGDLALDDPALRTHIDRCLGCRACETACPSGVPYGRLLEATRATMTRERPRDLVTRAALTAMANDSTRAVVMTVARLLRATRLSALLSRLPGRLGAGFGLIEASRPALPHRRYAATGTGTRGRVAVLTGCVMEGLFAETNRATERTLLVNDYALAPAEGQGCCGALHAHAGALARARALARRNIAAFDRSGAQYVAVNAAGCGAMLKEYGHLLRDDPDWHERARAFSARVRDVSELLAAAGPAAGAPTARVVAVDAPCHLLHAQRVRDEPLQTMRAVPSLDVRPLPDAEQCCGGAGIYNLQHPRIARDVLAPKLASIAASGAPLVATANPGCHLHIGAGLRRAGIAARCVHPVDLLDAAYAARTTTKDA
ncbi:MAG TPA: heterodisulfide reductase-related iron-sulfur binding cluster [Gemmatimonadaceae bacterium]|nr:heterodisulfide reductase-related iron-sulfur binding cluster [Gemmatimonadaceae bacterium]